MRVSRIIDSSVNARTHTHPINDVMDRIKLRIVSLLFVISENNNSQEKKSHFDRVMFGVNLTWYLWARNECLQQQCRRSVVAKQMLQKMSTSPKFNLFRALQVKISIFLLSNKWTDWKKMRVFSLDNQSFYLYDKKCEQICISLIGAPLYLW